MKRMPPLNHLLAFHVCAETLSFKQAAELLSVTPAAISQRVRQFEEQLGMQLFERQHKRVVLTREGAQLHETSRHAFDIIELGLSKLMGDSRPDRINVSVLPSFTQHWLIPRLGSFQSQQPELSIALMPSSQLIDFRQEDIDVGIRYGGGVYPDLHSELLLRDHLYAVCHPSYLQRHPYCCEQTIQDMDLIEDSRPDMTWPEWLQQAGYQASKRPSLIYGGADLVLNGALAGQGVALVRHSLAYRHIQQGNLIQIGEQSICSRHAYYLVAPAEHFKRPKVKRFLAWLQQECQDFWDESQHSLTPIAS